MNQLEIQWILNEAAEEAFPALDKLAAQAKESGKDDLDCYLYVYPNGHWVIENPQYLQDHNTLAQADAETPYESPAALAAALAETVSDEASEDPEEPSEDDWGTGDHSKFYALRESQHGSWVCGPLALKVDSDASTEEMWEAIADEMRRQNYFPNVWFIDDHGGITLMTPP